MIKLLVVEDDPQMLQAYEDNLNSFNKTAPEKIEIKIAEDLAQAMSALNSTSFDGAIIDLILKGGAREINAEGNVIIEQIINNLRFPIFVYSGNLGQLDPKFVENVLFRKYSRDNVVFKFLLDEIVKIHSTGVIKILGRTGLVEKYLTEIFWKHLARSIDYWAGKNKEKTLLRYTIAHLQEHLELDEKGEFEHYYPAEVYIVPPIKSFVFTGSILRHKTSSDHFIVLSPPCDLAQKKAKSIVMAAIEKKNMPLVVEKKNILEKKISEGMNPDDYRKFFDKQGEARETLNRLVSNSYANKYHYLPLLNGTIGGFINFQRLTSQSPEELEEHYELIASVASGFCKDIIARFSYYYSRQGQPDMDCDELVKHLLV